MPNLGVRKPKTLKKYEVQTSCSWSADYIQPMQNLCYYNIEITISYIINPKNSKNEKRLFFKCADFILSHNTEC